MRSYSSYRTAAVFVLLVSVLLLSTTLAYRATTRIEESERWVNHTYAVLQALDSIELTLGNAQTSATGFIATGKPEYLNSYRTSVSRVASKINLVRALTADNAEQKKAIAEVEKKTQLMEQNLDQVIGQGSSEEAGRVQDLMVELRQELRTMRMRENHLLAARSRMATGNLRTTRIGLVAGALVNLVLLVWAAFLITREQQQRSLMQQSSARLAAIVESSDDAIIGKTLDGTITSWNSGAERLYGYKEQEMVGRSIYDIVPQERREQLRSILERLGRGERIEHLETLRVRRDETLVEVELTVSPVCDSEAKIVGASAIARDITERKRLERSLHQLSVGILKAQDEERRRIAREIHDSTVQKLALLSMNLSQLSAAEVDARKVTGIKQSQELTAECVQELRTLSYVLHPPMLDELGLVSALKIYVEGIAKRSGIAISTELDPEVPRMSPELEMALFRVAQESLSNVLRHSGSKVASIRLLNHHGIELTITDEGKGIPPESQKTEGPAAVGVGIAGMNERIRQLGGILTIASSERGTTVTARIPNQRAANA